MRILGKTWMIIKILLVCGVLSSLFYIATDMIASTALYAGYSYIDQMYSELLAIGAPTRSLMISIATIYNVLVVAFAIGVLLSAHRNRYLRIAGIFLLVYGFVSGAGPFIPMHVRGSELTLTDTLHKIGTMVIVLSTLLSIVFGAASQRKAFRIYSIVTILVIFIFAALAGLQAPRIEAGLPTPWFGLIERVNIYAIMLWVLVFAVSLLRAHSTIPQRQLSKEKKGSLRLKELTAK